MYPNSPVHLDENAIERLIDFKDLVPAMKRAFSGELASPPRIHCELPGPSAPALLLMPAWRASESIGVKIVTVDAERGRRDMPAVEGIYVVLDGRSGAPSAILGARTLTAARTAAVSALAASFLAPEHASSLLMIGTGNLAPYLIRAHCSVRFFKKLMIWGRDPAKAQAVAASLGSITQKLEVEIVTDLRCAIHQADVVCCATSSRTAIISGVDISPSTHVDLVGSFSPGMREGDDALFERGRVIVDTMDAFTESGDLIEPHSAGIINAAEAHDLAALVKDATLHRRDRNEVTIFKAVGTAISDLAAAEHLLERYRQIESNSKDETTHGG